MDNTDKEEQEFTVKIPRGTIVKVEGHPVMLGESLYIKKVDENTFKIESHKIMESEEEEERSSNHS